MFHILADGEYWQDAKGMWAWPVAQAAQLGVQLKYWGYTVEFELYGGAR